MRSARRDFGSRACLGRTNVGGRMVGCVADQMRGTCKAGPVGREPAPN